ncbi:MAG TPA: DUF3857 domain-containing protein [Chitinophagaceae bacterium]|nr:DUF3857 domain-containing protein [Chitinophagaceae bacterium]
MRPLLFAALAVLLVVSSHAQKNKNKKAIPGFGKVEKSELELKECEFDKNAEAMVLFDACEVACVVSLNSVEFEIVRHVRLKVLQEKGRDVGDIHIPYHSYGATQSIRDFSAQTYNLDENGAIKVTKVDRKSSLYEKKLNKYETELAFTFPDVKVGSVLEYKYKLTTPYIPSTNWYFQRSIPVRYSELVLDFPVEIEVYSGPRCSLPFESNSESEATRNVQFYAMKNIPAMREEPAMLNAEDYMERVEWRPIAVYVGDRRIPLTSTWPKLIKSMMEDEDFGLQLKKEIPRTADLDAELAKLTDPYERMVTIHRYVKRNMAWNGFTGIWALDGVKSAWKEKKGTTGEINLILLNLLKDAGIRCFPLLVSTHDNGLVNTADPKLQFNKVLAWVEIGDQFYVLDGTDQQTPSHLIPEDVLLTEGLMLEKISATAVDQTFPVLEQGNSSWGWKTLWNDKYAYKHMILIMGSIDANGKMRGEASINSFDYGRIRRSAVAKQGTKDFIETYLSDLPPGLTVDSVLFENLDDETKPLVQKVYFTQQLNSSGDYRYFSSNLFTGLEKNPFVANERFSDVFFGANQYYLITGSFDIPPGWAPEELPQNTRMIMPDTSISIRRAAQLEGSNISVRYTLEFKKPFYPVGEYADFREFYKKLQNLLSEQFVIRKKP